MCGIAIPVILAASQIVPWGVAKDKRLNPSNGLCLSAIHDKVFDKGNNYKPGWFWGSLKLLG
jgi:predicted restriction endonuclease